jgi:hypothetical protein
MRLDSAMAVPCAGGCHDPIPVLVGTGILVGSAAGTLEPRMALLSGPKPDGSEECVFAHIHTPGRAMIDVYERTGGYEALSKAVRQPDPQQVVQIIAASGLNGRGGAGFPAGTKWRAVADAPGGPKTIVCNADEGDPGWFKDRVIMDYDPHAVVEGTALPAIAAILGYGHGIGVRNGCFCAHPYVVHLLDLPEREQEVWRKQVADGARSSLPTQVGHGVCRN